MGFMKLKPSSFAINDLIFSKKLFDSIPAVKLVLLTFFMAMLILLLRFSCCIKDRAKNI